MVSIGAPAGGIKEGEYITWASKWSMALTDGLGGDEEISYYMDESNGIFYLWWGDNQPWPIGNKRRFGVYKISDHSVVFESSSATHYVGNEPYTTGAGDYTIAIDCHGLRYQLLRSHQKYMLVPRDDSYTLEVWGAGSRLWSRDVRSDTGEAFCRFEAGYISLTGKYILFFDSESMKLWLYEGS